MSGDGSLIRDPLLKSPYSILIVALICDMVSCDRGLRGPVVGSVWGSEFRCLGFSVSGALGLRLRLRVEEFRVQRVGSRLYTGFRGFGDQFWGSGCKVWEFRGLGDPKP